jgi:hypothetical protein
MKKHPRLADRVFLIDASNELCHIVLPSHADATPKMRPFLSSKLPKNTSIDSCAAGMLEGIDPAEFDFDNQARI